LILEKISFYFASVVLFVCLSNNINWTIKLYSNDRRLSFYTSNLLSCLCDPGINI